MTTDLRTVDDAELRAILEQLAMLEEAGLKRSWQTLRVEVLEQLEGDFLDRKRMAHWGTEFPELLPPKMAGLEDLLDHFEELLEQCAAEQTISARLEQFQEILGLLADGEEAGTGLLELEEELHLSRNAYLEDPITLDEVSPASLISHRFLLEGLELWAEAVRAAHQGELETAAQLAEDGNDMLTAVSRWEEELSTD